MAMIRGAFNTLIKPGLRKLMAWSEQRTGITEVYQGQPRKPKREIEPWPPPKPKKPGKWW